MDKIIQRLNRLFSYRTSKEYSYYKEINGKIVRIWYKNGIEDRRIIRL
jgi:hypothetical protein